MHLFFFPHGTDVALGEDLTPDDPWIVSVTPDLFPAVAGRHIISAARLRMHFLHRTVVPVGVVAHAAAFKLHQRKKK